MTEVPRHLKEGNTNTFDWESNFWMNSWVANQAYNRYDLMIPDIRKVQNGLENKFVKSRGVQDKELSDLANAGNMEEVVKRVNAEGAAIAHEATDTYRDLAIYLLVRYMDGNKKKVDENGEFIYNEYGIPVYPDFPGYNKEYYENIVKETGDHFLVPEEKK